MGAVQRAGGLSERGDPMAHGFETPGARGRSEQRSNASGPETPDDQAGRADTPSLLIFGFVLLPSTGGGGQPYLGLCFCRRRGGGGKRTWVCAFAVDGGAGANGPGFVLSPSAGEQGVGPSGGRIGKVGVPCGQQWPISGVYSKLDMSCNRGGVECAFHISFRIQLKRKNMSAGNAPTRPPPNCEAGDVRAGAQEVVDSPQSPLKPFACRSADLVLGGRSFSVIFAKGA